MKHSKTCIIVLLGILLIGMAIGVTSLLMKEDIQLIPNRKVCAVDPDLEFTDTDNLLPIKCSTVNIMNPVHYAYINLDGQIFLSDTNWNYASLYEDNQLAIVSSGLLSGIIDKQGHYIQDISFNHIHYIGHNYYFLQLDETNYMGHYKETEKIFHIEISEYEWVYDFSDGLAAVKTSDDKIGYIDTNLELVIDPNFDYLTELHYQFHNGYVILIQDNRYGIINQSNDIIFDFEYENLSFVNEEYIVFEQNQLKGLMSITGDIILPASYTAIGKISDNGIVAISLDGETYAFYNITTGQLLTDYQYFQIADYKFVNTYHYFKDGYAITSLDGRTYQLINQDFEPVLEYGVKGIKIINENTVILLTAEDHYQIYHINTGERMNIEAKDLEVYPEFGIIAIGIEYNEEGTTVFQLINFKGEVIFPQLKIYDDMNIRVVSNKSYLQFSGEYKGNVFTSYLTEDHKVLWLPNND
jgi:WG containing repeat